MDEGILTFEDKLQVDFMVDRNYNGFNVGISGSKKEVSQENRYPDTKKKIDDIWCNSDSVAYIYNDLVEDDFYLHFVHMNDIADFDSNLAYHRNSRYYSNFVVVQDIVGGIVLIGIGSIPNFREDFVVIYVVD